MIGVVIFMIMFFMVGRMKEWGLFQSWLETRKRDPLYWEIGRGVLWGFPASFYLLMFFPEVAFSVPIASRWRKASLFAIISAFLFVSLVSPALYLIFWEINSRGHYRDILNFIFNLHGIHGIYFAVVPIIFAVMLHIVSLVQALICHKMLARTERRPNRTMDLFRLLLYSNGVFPFYFLAVLITPWSWPSFIKYPVANLQVKYPQLGGRTYLPFYVTTTMALLIFCCFFVDFANIANRFNG